MDAQGPINVEGFEDDLDQVTNEIDEDEEGSP